MQATEKIPVERINKLVDSIYQLEQPEMLSANSEFGKELEQFSSAAEVKARIARCVDEGTFFYSFAVCYPSSEGRIETDLVSLNPEYCQGHTFRYSAGGWGAIQLQLDFKHKPNVECRIAVNSEKRALLWEPHSPKWAPVSVWKWSVVEKHARRLCRKLKGLAQQGAPRDAPKVARP